MQRHSAFGRRGVWRTVCAAAVGVLAGGTTLGLVAVSAGPAAVAGADTAGYTLTCNATGTFAGKLTTPIVISGAVTTGTLPATVTAGSSFTLTNYGLKINLPATGIFGDAAGLTISGTEKTSVTATGATPTTTKTTLTVPATPVPKPMPAAGAPITASGPDVSFTAATTPGPITVSTGTTATLAITVVTLSVSVGLTCTSPATQIAKVTGAAPTTKVTGVLPNAAPLAGGTTTTITGTGFTGATAVTFGTAPATSFTVTSGTKIIAVVPPHAAGTVNVQVASPDGTSTLTTADHFTYTNGPIVTGVTPDYGPRSGGTSVTITGLQLTGANDTGVTAVAFDMTGATSFTVTSPTQITAVSPPHTGAVVDVTVSGPTGTSVLSSQDQFTYGLPGYWTVASDGGVFSYGDVGFYGSMGGQPLNKPIVGMTATPTGQGYWLVASDGGVFAFGAAQFYGSMGGQPLNKPIVAMASTPTGGGYWLVASDGGIFAFGNAPFYGSTGGGTLPAPIVSLVAAPTGGGAVSDGTASGGYWEIGATGTVYAFGTPGIYGGMGGRALNAPIVGGAATPDFYGDWEVGADGGIYAFGNATYFGSMGGKSLNKPIVGMATTPGGGGYWEVASDGGIFSFGDATFYGSMGGQPLNAPMVGIAVA